MAFVQNKTAFDLQKEALGNFIRHKTQSLRVSVPVYRLEFSKELTFLHALLPELKSEIPTAYSVFFFDKEGNDQETADLSIRQKEACEKRPG